MSQNAVLANRTLYSARLLSGMSIFKGLVAIIFLAFDSAGMGVERRSASGVETLLTALVILVLLYLQKGTVDRLTSKPSSVNKKTNQTEMSSVSGSVSGFSNIVSSKSKSTFPSLFSRKKASMKMIRKKSNKTSLAASVYNDIDPIRSSATEGSPQVVNESITTESYTGGRDFAGSMDGGIAEYDTHGYAKIHSRSNSVVSMEANNFAKPLDLGL